MHSTVVPRWFVHAFWAFVIALLQKEVARRQGGVKADHLFFKIVLLFFSDFATENSKNVVVENFTENENCMCKRYLLGSE